MSWRASREYRLWRVAVLRRDVVCQLCNEIKHRQAHHLNSGSYHPEERFDTDNGITLCKACHSHYHNDYHRSFREKCTKYDYWNFMALVNYVRSLA